MFVHIGCAAPHRNASGGNKPEHSGRRRLRSGAIQELRHALEGERGPLGVTLCNRAGGSSSVRTNALVAVSRPTALR